MALVVGSEATGLSPEVRADTACATISIPLAGGVESLNAAVAGSIALFEARRQRDDARSSSTAGAAKGREESRCEAR